MFDETKDGFLSGHAEDETDPLRNPVDAVSAVAEPRAAADADAPEQAPDDGYGDFAWPEGYEPDPAALEKFVPLARKLGLSKEGAQELAALHAELDRERRHAQARFIAKNNEDWIRDIHSHPEFGGRNLERAGADVAAVLRRYGSPLLAAQIRQMNVQNWPEMFFFLARVARAVNEDCSPAGAGVEPPAASTAKLLFPGLR